MTVPCPITFRLGEVWEFQITCLDADGHPIDPILVAEFRIAGSSLLFKATLTDFIEVTGTGICLMKVNPDDQPVLSPAGNYSYEFFVSNNDLEGSVQANGRLTIQDTLRHKYP